MVNCDTFKIVIVLNSYFQTNLQINCTKDFLLQWEFYMRVLLVEDDVRIANFVSKGLRENSYAVDVANDGEQGLYQTSINDYDLIILDVMLPKVDGFEVCSKLYGSGIITPILMLTARDAIEDKITGLDFGADDYLTKPFEFRELLARLRALLRRKNEFRLPKIRIADLELDTISQRVWRNGETAAPTTENPRPRPKMVPNSFEILVFGK